MLLKDHKPLTKIISVLFAYLYDVWKFAGDIYFIHLMKNHCKSINELKGKLPQPGNPSKIAVIATYPSDESIVFTKNLLNAFIKNDFYILVLSTRVMTTSQRETILSHCHQLIERPNLGQDLGSYKQGLDWLEKQGNKLATADMVVLANDSMFYPASFDKVLESMVNCTETWQCLFENFHGHHHAQSFFLLFRKEMFKSLQSFWKRYIPYRSRVYAIQKGEIGMSRVFKKAGFFPHTYYSSVAVTTALQEQIQLENINDMPLTSLLIESYGGLPTREPSSYSLRLHAKRAVTQVGVIMNHVNPTHTVGLVAAKAMEAPIKRDCCYRGFYDPVSIIKHVKGFTKDELIVMEKDLRKKGTGSSVTGWRRLLYARGRI
jgi:hypothetical protein